MKKIRNQVKFREVDVTKGRIYYEMEARPQLPHSLGFWRIWKDGDKYVVSLPAPTNADEYDNQVKALEGAQVFKKEKVTYYVPVPKK
mgnify:CR=1 FL=1